MNIPEHIQHLKSLGENTEQRAAEFIIIPAAGVLTANIINRNAQRGENTDGTKRDGYSTKPMYANKEKFITKVFTPQGKNNSSPTFKNGKQRKSMYLDRGYKQLRDIQGRRTDIKNYEYTGDTLNAFGFGQNDKGVAIGFRNEKAAKIRKALEKKNGRAFYPSQNEIDEYSKEVAEQTKKLQINILTGVE